MNKLVILGDSFGDVFHNKPVTWMHTLSAYLNLELDSHCLSSTGLDFMYHSFDRIRPSLHPRDRLIVLVSELTRRWWFLDRPEESSIYNIKDPRFRKFLKLYIHDLTDDTIPRLHLNMFLAYLNKHTTHLETPPLCLSCFSDTQDMFEPGVKGCLWTVSKNELRDLNDLPKICKNDPRLNHLSHVNHCILAEKIFVHWKTQEPLDLTQGFKRALL